MASKISCSSVLKPFSVKPFLSHCQAFPRAPEHLPGLLRSSYKQIPLFLCLKLCQKIHILARSIQLASRREFKVPRNSRSPAIEACVQILLLGLPGSTGTVWCVPPCAFYQGKELPHLLPLGPHPAVAAMSSVQALRKLSERATGLVKLNFERRTTLSFFNAQRYTLYCTLKATN